MTEWRKAPWALAIWSVLMTLWLATSAGGLGDLRCVGESGAALAVCEAGVNIGRTLGLGFVLIVWLIGAIAFGLVWVISRPNHQAR